MGGVLSHGEQGVCLVWGSHGLISIFFTEQVFLLVFSSQDLQCALGKIAGKCEFAGMRISYFTSETMVLNWKCVECSLILGVETLPQAEEFKYQKVLFI